MSDMSTDTSSSYLDFNALTRLKGEASRDPSKAIRQTAEQFEAYFIQQMMKTMRESVDKSDLVDSSNMDTYQDLMDKEVSLKMVKRGGMGLADMMERQMLISQGLSTQDALQMHPQAHAPISLNPLRDPMSLKGPVMPAYELQRVQQSYKLGDKP